MLTAKERGFLLAEAYEAVRTRETIRNLCDVSNLFYRAAKLVRQGAEDSGLKRTIEGLRFAEEDGTTAQLREFDAFLDGTDPDKTDSTFGKTDSWNDVTNSWLFGGDF